MQDSEIEEDESGRAPQEEAEAGRKILFRKSENQPSSPDVQKHMKTHIPDHTASEEGRGATTTIQMEESVDLVLRFSAEPPDPHKAKHGLTLAMVESRRVRCTMGCETCRRLVG